MKKEYVKPEMVMEELLLEGMLAQSGGNPGGEVGGGLGEEGEEPLSNDRRGGWGDLWN